MRSHSNTQQTAHHANMDSQGIQQLLVAEKRAAEKVAEAKKRKAKRIKQAREEAEVEIEKYSVQRLNQFIEYESRLMGNEDMVEKIEQTAEKQIKECVKNVEDNKTEVIEDLVSFVMDVEPKVHSNFYVLRNFNKI